METNIMKIIHYSMVSWWVNGDLLYNYDILYYDLVSFIYRSYIL